MTNPPVPVSASPAVPAAAPSDSKGGVWLYLVVAFGALAVFLAPFATGAFDPGLLAFVVPIGQWIPALAVVVVAAVTKQKGLLPKRRRPSWRALVSTFSAFAVVLLLHLTLATTLGVIDLDPSGLLLGLAVLPIAALLMLPSLGEEIGWRGYLLGRWRLLGPWRASLAVAGVWAAWHAPLFAVYIAKDDMAAETALASTVSLVCGGALLGMLTLRFDSLWPAVFGHALMNSLLVWGYGLVQPAPEDLDPARFWGFNAIGWVLLILAAAVVRIGLRRSTSRSL